jgi:excisionase family DNA binding protein
MTLLLTIPQLAEELGVDKRTVYRLFKSGELASIPVLYVGASPRVRRQDVEAFLAEKVELERVRQEARQSLQTLRRRRA